MICRNCGTDCPNGTPVCPRCGAQLMAPTPGYYPQPQVPGKGMGIASMVLGIISLVLFCIWYLAIPCAIIGVALGGAGASKAKEVGAKNGMATAGITCSCIALGIAILFLILGLIGLAEMGAFA